MLPHAQARMVKSMSGPDDGGGAPDTQRRQSFGLLGRLGVLGLYVAGAPATRENRSTLRRSGSWRTRLPRFLS